MVAMERITLSLLKVVAQFVDQPAAEWFGYRLAKATGLPSGRVHENLIRLERAGWIEARWEDETDKEPHRGPRRRLYRLTAPGHREALHLLSEHAPSARRDARPGMCPAPEK